MLRYFASDCFVYYSAPFETVVLECTSVVLHLPVKCLQIANI